MFLEKDRSGKEQELFEKIMGHTFILKLAYLADLFTRINQLSLSLQGNMVNIPTTKDEDASIKFQFYRRKVKAAMWL